MSRWSAKQSRPKSNDANIQDLLNKMIRNTKGREDAATAVNGTAEMQKRLDNLLKRRYEDDQSSSTGVKELQEAEAIRQFWSVNKPILRGVGIETSEELRCSVQKDARGARFTFTIPALSIETSKKHQLATRFKSEYYRNRQVLVIITVCDPRTSQSSEDKENETWAKAATKQTGHSNTAPLANNDLYGINALRGIGITSISLKRSQDSPPPPAPTPPPSSPPTRPAMNVPPTSPPPQTPPRQPPPPSPPSSMSKSQDATRRVLSPGVEVPSPAPAALGSEALRLLPVPLRNAVLRLAAKCEQMLGMESNITYASVEALLAIPVADAIELVDKIHPHKDMARRLSLAELVCAMALVHPKYTPACDRTVYIPNIPLPHASTSLQGDDSKVNLLDPAKMSMVLADLTRQCGPLLKYSVEPSGTGHVGVFEFVTKESTSNAVNLSTLCGVPVQVYYLRTGRITQGVTLSPEIRAQLEKMAGRGAGERLFDVSPLKPQLSPSKPMLSPSKPMLSPGKPATSPAKSIPPSQQIIPPRTNSLVSGLLQQANMMLHSGGVSPKVGMDPPELVSILPSKTSRRVVIAETGGGYSSFQATMGPPKRLIWSEGKGGLHVIRHMAYRMTSSGPVLDIGLQQRAVDWTSLKAHAADLARVADEVGIPHNLNLLTSSPPRAHHFDPSPRIATSQPENAGPGIVVPLTEPLLGFSSTPASSPPPTSSASSSPPQGGKATKLNAKAAPFIPTSWKAPSDSCSIKPTTYRCVTPAPVHRVRDAPTLEAPVAVLMKPGETAVVVAMKKEQERVWVKLQNGLWSLSRDCNVVYMEEDSCALQMPAAKTASTPPQVPSPSKSTPPDSPTPDDQREKVATVPSSPVKAKTAPSSPADEGSPSIEAAPLAPPRPSTPKVSPMPSPTPATPPSPSTSPQHPAPPPVID